MPALRGAGWETPFDRTCGEPRPVSIHRVRDFDDVVFAGDFRFLEGGLAAVRAFAAFDEGPALGLRVDFVFRATRRLPATASGCSGATSRTRSYTSRAVAEDPCRSRRAASFRRIRGSSEILRAEAIRFTASPIRPAPARAIARLFRIPGARGVRPAAVRRASTAPRHSP